MRKLHASRDTSTHELLVSTVVLAISVTGFYAVWLQAAFGG